MLIEEATIRQLDQIVPLFDQYRIFYEQESDFRNARIFLEERFQKGDSVILLAYIGNEAIAFTQLYFTFSSVSLKPTLILNDLYVLPEYRGQGAGALLLKRAQRYCLENNYKGLALETAIDNPAQKLYEKLGWKKDSHCFHYFWSAQ